MKDFKNKIAVITGGASGVGLSLGRALAKEGAEVILTDIEKEALKKAVDLLKEEGLAVHNLIADVTDLNSMEVLSETINSKFGNVHLLFNNASIAPQEASYLGPFY
jgi:NAD(P)-dependent dehydrogenase (short-subunit alcohol dehydrogenase family)